jgi:hypothetical protein
VSISQGAEHFSKLEHTLDDLKPKPKTLQIVGIGFGIVTFVAALIWQAARYPDRGEFNEAIRALQQENSNTADSLHKVQTDSLVMQKDVKAIQESQDREEHATEVIREKLDHLIVAGRR